MMAQSVPHQATDKKRVKVYELRNNDWYDRGTGFCTATYSNDLNREPRVMVESEDEPNRILLETKIQREDGFQKQQETLIVWQEPGSGVDMALSFQEAEGCAMIWKFVSKVQQSLQTHVQGVEDTMSESELPLDAQPTISLPHAELGHLAEIETSIRLLNNTPSGRDALAKFIMADDYIGKLIPLVEMAEDLESLSDLHRLCNIMKLVLLLNDTSIIEQAVSDEYVMGVVGALEYDPDFPSHKANHRHWLDNKGRYKEVVRIDDEQTRRKIHQTYRLQYLKDVVLARILDDPTFSVLNSLIFFNQVDILNYVQGNAPYMAKLFDIFNQQHTDQKRKKDAVLFIQQCCSIAKTVQAPARQALYTSFLHHGLLHVILFGLRHNAATVRVGAMDILNSCIEHDPQMIRQTMYHQLAENISPVTDSLIDLLLVEVDLGVKAQISDALKVLLDPGAPAQGGPDHTLKANGGDMINRVRLQQSVESSPENFISNFYSRSALKLFKPLLEINHDTDMDFTSQQASMFTHLVELLCFFIRHHHRHSKLFLRDNDVTSRITQLFRCRDKYLQLVAVRFFRCLLGMPEDFYINHLKERAIFGPIFDVLISTIPKDNLLCSACLDFFEYIKKENLKDLVRHLVLNYQTYIDRLRHLRTFETLLELKDRYEAQDENSSNMDCFLEADEDLTRKPPPNTRMMEHIIVDPREDEYWNEPDEAEEELAAGGSGEKASSTNGSASSKLMVDYASDEEADQAADGEGDGSAKSSPGSAESGSTLPVATPPERLSEKRRREEEDDDELGKLMQNKRRNSNTPTASSTSTNTAQSAGVLRRRKSFTAGSGNGTPRKISISLSSTVRTGGEAGSDDS